MPDIAAIITALSSTSIEGAITGIKRAYDRVPSGVDLPLPCVINTPFEGDISGAEAIGAAELSGVRVITHRIRTQVLCSLQSDLSDSENEARPFLDRFVRTVDRFKTLNATANVQDATVASYRYGNIKLREGDPGYIGWEFIVKVLEIESGTNIVGTTGPAL